MANPHAYSLVLVATAVTASKTLLQVKSGAAPCTLVRVGISQVTKTTSELQKLQIIQYTAAPTFATVTSVAANPLDPNSPAALAVNGTTATGTNASAEPSGGTSVTQVEDNWNVLNGTWTWLPVPEERIRCAQGGLQLSFKLGTAPAASQTTSCYLVFLEDR